MNNRMPDYRRTLKACNFAGFIQSATMNLSPYFFIPLSSLYGITYTQIGFLVFVNFAAQFAADLFRAAGQQTRLSPVLHRFAVCHRFWAGSFACAPWLMPGNIFCCLLLPP